MSHCGLTHVAHQKTNATQTFRGPQQLQPKRLDVRHGKALEPVALEKVIQAEPELVEYHDDVIFKHE